MEWCSRPLGSEGAQFQQQSHQLVGAQDQDAEHQMTHHLGVAPDRDIPATELVLEAGIAALGDGALVVADGIGRFEFGLLATPRVVINQGDVAEVAAVLVQLEAAIGRIHHIVEIGDSRSAHQR
jgi:hypothetical protein